MKHMKKIIHIDEMKFEDFLNFIKDFSKNYNSYEISEKIDGQNFSFGFEDNEFYTKTKRSLKVTDFRFYDGAKYREGFLDFHKKIHVVKFKEFCDYMFNLFFCYENQNIQFFVELLPWNQTNTILYKKEKCVILLDILIDNKSIFNELSNIDKKLISMKLEKLVPSWSFYNKNIYHFINLNINHINTFEKIYNKNKNILTSRKKVDKLKKDKVKKILKELQLNIKNQLLKKIKNSKSMLTDNKIEGVVIMKNDVDVKVVDKNSFSKENEKLQGINRKIDEISKKLKREISLIFNNHDLLTNTNKIYEKLNEALYIKKSFNSDLKFFNYNEIISIIIEDIKSENNITYETEESLKENLLSLFETLNNKVNELYNEWFFTIRDNQTEIHKEITKDKFANLFKRINNLKKSEFLKIDEIESLLIKTLISNSLKQEIMEKYLWE